MEPAGRADHSTHGIFLVPLSVLFFSLLFHVKHCIYSVQQASCRSHMRAIIMASDIALFCPVPRERLNPLTEFYCKLRHILHGEASWVCIGAGNGIRRRIVTPGVCAGHSYYCFQPTSAAARLTALTARLVSGGPSRQGRRCNRDWCQVLLY